MKADKTLDCVGLYCPMPIVKTAQKIKELKTGEILEVVADDKGIKQDMPAWCQSTGHECLGIEEDSGEIKVYVKKTH
ncbi:MAG: sulfurtransferase TusA family protein [Chloroflexota bacterium]